MIKAKAWTESETLAPMEGKILFCFPLGVVLIPGGKKQKRLE